MQERIPRKRTKQPAGEVIGDRPLIGNSSDKEKELYSEGVDVIVGGSTTPIERLSQEEIWVDPDFS